MNGVSMQFLKSYLDFILNVREFVDKIKVKKYQYKFICDFQLDWTLRRYGVHGGQKAAAEAGIRIPVSVMRQAQFTGDTG